MNCFHMSIITFCCQPIAFVLHEKLDKYFRFLYVSAYDNNSFTCLLAFFCLFINTSPGDLFSFEQLLKLVPVPIPGQMGYHKMRMSFLVCAPEAQVCGHPGKKLFKKNCVFSIVESSRYRVELILVASDVTG